MIVKIAGNEFYILSAKENKENGLVTAVSENGRLFLAPNDKTAQMAAESFVLDCASEYGEAFLDANAGNPSAFFGSLLPIEGIEENELSFIPQVAFVE